MPHCPSSARLPTSPNPFRPQPGPRFQMTSPRRAQTRSDRPPGRSSPSVEWRHRHRPRSNRCSFIYFAGLKKIKRFTRSTQAQNDSLITRQQTRKPMSAIWWAAARYFLIPSQRGDKNLNRRPDLDRSQLATHIETGVLLALQQA